MTFNVACHDTILHNDWLHCTSNCQAAFYKYVPQQWYIRRFIQITVLLSVDKWVYLDGTYTENVDGWCKMPN